MKKRCFVLIAALSVLSVCGCGKTAGSELPQDRVLQEEVKITPDDSEPVETNQSMENGGDIAQAGGQNQKKGSYQLLNSADYRELILYDTVGQKEINTYPLGENETYYSNQVFTYENGYAAVIQNTANGEVRFVKLDNQLNETESIILSDLIDREILENGFDMALSKDGNKIVWGLTFQLYMYDLSNQIQGYLIESTKDDIAFLKLCFVDNDTLAYIGSSAAESEGDSCVGLIHLATGELEKYAVKNYTASGLSVNGNYVCVTDYIQHTTGKSGGRVVLLNASDKTLSEVPVAEFGSTMACVSSDGAYVFAVNDVAEADEYYIMQYNAADYSLVETYPLDFDSPIRIYSLSCNDSKESVTVVYMTEEKFGVKNVSYK